MEILLALLIIALGLTLVFWGSRFARIAIALWGFFSGLALGAAVMGDLSGTPIFGTLLGIVVGTVAGLVLAVVAYIYYAAAVIATAALLGYWLGSGLILLFGFDPGFLSASIGIMLGLAVGAIALALNAPKYVLITFTAIAGAVTTVGGLLLLFNVVPLQFLSYDTAGIVIRDSFFWTLATIALTVIGFVIQQRLSGTQQFIKWSADEDRGSQPGSMTPKTHAT